MVKKNGIETTRIVRWIARISSGISAALILIIFVGEGLTEGFGSILKLTGRESYMMAALGVVWLGLLLGWKWELVGGLFTICGMVVFYLLDYFFSGTFPRGPFFLLFASPGLLYLYLGLQNENGAVSRD